MAGACSSKHLEDVDAAKSQTVWFFTTPTIKAEYTQILCNEHKTVCHRPQLKLDQLGWPPLFID